MVQTNVSHKHRCTNACARDRDTETGRALSLQTTL